MSSVTAVTNCILLAVTFSPISLSALVCLVSLDFCSLSVFGFKVTFFLIFFNNLFYILICDSLYNIYCILLLLLLLLLLLFYIYLQGNFNKLL